MATNVLTARRARDGNGNRRTEYAYARIAVNVDIPVLKKKLIK